MKEFLKKHRSSWFVFSCLLAIAAILVCNLWSLMIGNCAIHDFLLIPPIGWVLIFSNIVGALILYFVKHRNRSKNDGSFCPSCQTDLSEAWGYCPKCGSEVDPGLHSATTL